MKESSSQPDLKPSAVGLPQALVCILSFVLHGEYHPTEITQIQNH